MMERTRTEQALAESENRLRAILESEPECVKLIDVHGTLIEMNPAGLAMIEADSLEQVKGRNVFPLIAPAHREAFVNLIRAVYAGETGELEFEIIGLKGTSRWLETRAVPLRNGQGVIVAALGVTRDITEHRHALLALRESEERFRQLADSVPQVFWLSDTRERRLLYVSPAFERIWGVARHPLADLPRVWLESVHSEDRDRVAATLLAAPPGQLPAWGHSEFEYRIRRPDGTIRLIRAHAAPVMDAEGRLVRLAGLAEDVTEHRQLEEQLRQTQKMESIGLLAGGIAHDFNNILTVIAGNSETIAAVVGSGHAIAPYVADIRRAAERAASLTRQLLTFSRRQVLEPMVLELNAIVTDTEKMLRRLIGEDIKLTVSLGRGVSHIKVDPGSLVQVLMNLVVNARDAMPAGGRLTIRTADVDLDDRATKRLLGIQPGRYATLIVADNGVGMTDEVKSHLFEPFFSTKRIDQGTGLGLAVVHGIVSQSGGCIDVDSETNRGTTFTIYFPVADEPATLPRELAPASRRGTETVLVAEDEPDVRNLAARALEVEGYTVLEASDGKDALRIVDRHRAGIDLIVADVVMPEMDGRELVEALRTRFPGVKVLYTSGYTDDAVLRRGVLRSEVVFLQKPYTPQSLLHKCREVLERV